MVSTRSQTQTDWTNMSLSDWMDITPSEWMDRMRSGWDASYADLMNTSPSDWWARLYNAGMSQPAAFVGTPAERQRPYGAYERDPRHRHHHHHDPCPRCGHDPCECYCCIGDVDLAVYSHVGEQRVIQMVIENERHREAEITLEFSDWTTRSGKAAPVETVLLEPKSFTLASCGEQNVTLVVKIGAATDQTRTTDAEKEKAATEAGALAGTPDRTKLPDVDDCLVATADLRLVGCDHRPLRIAVAILPRDCDPYRVHCGCTCC